MTESAYPDAIQKLPRADVPLEGVRAWLSQGEDHQVMFVDIDPIGEIHPTTAEISGGR